MEYLYKGVPKAGGDVPVNVSDVIAWLVIPHLGEFHAPTLKGAFILARKKVAGQTTGPKMKSLDFLE
jgi:hypothetical protein